MSFNCSTPIKLISRPLKPTSISDLLRLLISLWHNPCMSKTFPTTFYHSISQTRLKDAVKQEALPGLSRFHLDPEGKNPGVWLSDNLTFVAKDQRYGGEQSDEVLATWDANLMAKITGNKDAKPLVIKKPISPIVLEIRDLEEDRLLQHPLLHEQYFYSGDLDWRKVRSFKVAENDKKTEEVAETLARALKEKGIEVEVETYKMRDIREDFEIKQNLNSTKKLTREDNEGKY